jgi:hypothetical protein
VGFFGGGFGFGVGWFPLGFGEPFFPWFHCRHEFFERINVRNTFIRNRNVFNTNVHNFNFVNAHNVHAVTVANRNTFVNGQAINRGAMHITPASLKGAQVTNSVGLKPTPHSSLGAANMNSRVATPTAAIQNRAVVARTAPAQGASHSPVRTFNSGGLTSGRPGNLPMNNAKNSPELGGMKQRQAGANGPTAMNHQGATPNSSAMSPRQRELSQNRPPSAANNNASQRAGNGSRTWEAQGNTTDRGRAPSGFGSSNRPANTPAQTSRTNETNRPPWARGSQPGASGAGSARPATPNYNTNRPNYSNNGRSYSQPSRSYDQPSRSYNAPSRTYNPPARSYNPPPNRSYSPPRTYSAPSHSYSAPSHSYSAPSRSYGGGGGGGGYRGGGSSGGGSSGGGSHSGGGGGSHGGGSSSHGHR